MLAVFQEGFANFQYLFWQLWLPITILFSAFAYLWILLFIWHKSR